MKEEEMISLSEAKRMILPLEKELKKLEAEFKPLLTKIYFVSVKDLISRDYIFIQGSDLIGRTLSGREIHLCLSEKERGEILLHLKSCNNYYQRRYIDDKNAVINILAGKSPWYQGDGGRKFLSSLHIQPGGDREQFHSLYRQILDKTDEIESLYRKIRR